MHWQIQTAGPQIIMLSISSRDRGNGCPQCVIYTTDDELLMSNSIYIKNISFYYIDVGLEVPFQTSCYRAFVSQGQSEGQETRTYEFFSRRKFTLCTFLFDRCQGARVVHVVIQKDLLTALSRVSVQ